MASNGVQATNYQVQASQHPEPTSQHHCKECGLTLNSAESLDVHLQYHKENLLNKWALQAAAAQPEESNNNNSNGSSSSSTGKPTTMKREFISNSVTPSESTDGAMVKKSPEYGNRATPDAAASFGHPPTPQSYHSASSPYQNPPENNFSPGFQNYQPVKQERHSPPVSQFQQNYSYPEGGGYYGEDSPTMQTAQSYQQDYLVNKMQGSNYRYDPYTRMSPYDRKTTTQGASSSPAFPAQPTPSPSPKQCDKCGFVCDSAQQLIDHINITHPPTPAPAFQQSHFMFPGEIKEEQSDILDLDSHKVHHVYQEDDKRQNGELNGQHVQHAVTNMLPGWPQQKMFSDQRMYMHEQKMYSNGVPPPLAEQKMYQPQVHPGDFMANPMAHEGGAAMAQQMPYRPFEGLPQPGGGPMMNNQVPNAPVPTAPTTPKGTNWKSNEARRPKTYNCTACNKWFTSSGHLKRHYNTTLHKNAVKSSGQPDPASLPISAHHHPTRDSSASREDQNNSSPGEESRGEDSLPPNFDRPVPSGGLLQQPPNGPYDRQPAPNIGMHHPSNLHHPPMHSPMGPNSNPPMMPGHGSPPNAEAGPSVASNLDSRGLLNFNTPNPNTSPHGFTMAPMMPMDNSGQFQMYPNELAPHVLQTMDTNNPNTTGETEVEHNLLKEFTEDVNKQPLPCFAQIQGQRYGVLTFENANVGGMGPVTEPQYVYSNVAPQEQYIFVGSNNDDYQLTVMTTAEVSSSQVSPKISGQISPPMTTAFMDNGATPMQHQYVMMNGGETVANEPGDSPNRPEDAKVNRSKEVDDQHPLVTSTVTTVKHMCIQCQKPFAKSCYLTQHNKTFHSGAKPFKCAKCGKRYSCESAHKAHQIKHSGEKPYKCQECPKQFNHKTDLRRHMCVHTGHKPYTCDTCGKGFIRKDHMLKHKETHIKKTSKALTYRCR